MDRWILYGTRACHLCDQAATLLDEAGIDYRWVDIALDRRLTVRYGTRIPVLQDTRSGRELEWPFDTLSLRRFVEMEEAR